MARAGLKKLLVAVIGIFALGLYAGDLHAGWGSPCGCGGLGFGAGAYNASGWATWCGWGCHHGANRCGCGYGCGCCGCSLCNDPCGTCGSYWGSPVGVWGTPVVGACNCGTVTAPPAGAIPSLPPAGTPTPPAGVTPPSGTVVPPLPPAHTSIEPLSADSMLITVWVPDEAKVTINGLLTKSTGRLRRFVSSGVQPGHTYKYEVKAEVVREGKTVAEVQTVSLTAGERGNVAFRFNTSDSYAQNR
jgi:uncharacterized protein (TIGR03000 family)